MNNPLDSSLLLIASIILSEKGIYSDKLCLGGSERIWEERTIQVYFVTTIVHLIYKQGRYNILEQIQRLVQHFQAISTWKGLYIPCYGRLGVAVLGDFNHRTIQVYVYTDGLSTLTVVYSPPRHHE